MSDSLVTIKIKSPTPSIPQDLSFSCHLDSTIQDLKARIQERCEAGGKDQNVVLIYRGKILLDEETIRKTVGESAFGENGKDKDGGVVAFHAIVRPKPGAPARVEKKKADEKEEETTTPAVEAASISSPLDAPEPSRLPEEPSLATVSPYTVSQEQSGPYTHFTTLSNTTSTLTGLTLSTPTLDFRLSTRRTPEGGFILVGPTGATAILYPNTPQASSTQSVTAHPSYTFRISGSNLQESDILNTGDRIIPPPPPAPAAPPAEADRQDQIIANAQARIGEAARDRTNDLWLALKLGALLWLLTDRRDVRRTVGMFVAAILIFVTQTGLLTSFTRSLSALYNDLFPPLHPAPVPGPVQEQQATAGPQDPAELAARLMQQRQAGGAVQGVYRNVERVVGLLIASLVPDVGERRVRGFEEEVRRRVQVVQEAPVVAEVQQEGVEMPEGMERPEVQPAQEAGVEQGMEEGVMAQ